MDPKSFYGIEFHEWAGLMIGLLFIIHKMLNWNWIKKVTLSFFGKCPRRVRFNYILDSLLLAGIILMILSGIAISKTIDFSWLNLGGTRKLWRALHTSSSFITLALFGIHLGLHWNWVLQRLNFKNTRMKRRISFAILSLAILTVGVIAMNKLNYLESSLWIFRMHPEKQTEIKPFLRYDRPEIRKSPGAAEERVQGKRWRKGTTEQATTDSISYISAGKGRVKTGRNTPTGIFRKSKGKERTNLFGTNKINPGNVIQFAAVFASFTVIAIYADLFCHFISRKRKGKHGC